MTEHGFQGGGNTTTCSAQLRAKVGALSAVSKRRRFAAAAVVGIGLLGLAGCGGSDDASTSSSAKSSAGVSSTSSTADTSMDTTSTTADESSTETTESAGTSGAGDIVLEPLTLAKGNGTVFGGIHYEATSGKVTNGVDDSRQADFDGKAASTGPTMVRIDVTLKNTIPASIMPITPKLKLADDPVLIEGATVRGKTLDSLGEKAAGRASFDFELPDGTAASADAIKGASLVLQTGDLVAAGFPLDVQEPAAVMPAAKPISAKVDIGGHASGSLTVSDVRAALDAEVSLGAGADEAADYRAPDGEIWLAFNARLDCVGRGGGKGDCYFGLEDAQFRVDVDGAPEGFELRDYSMSPSDPIAPGASVNTTLWIRVPVGSAYTLLLGDPATPDAVLKTPLPVADDVKALYDSVADYQQ